MFNKKAVAYRIPRQWVFKYFSKYVHLPNLQLGDQQIAAVQNCLVQSVIVVMQITIDPPPLIFKWFAP
jgi:hypothetical protein